MTNEQITEIALANGFKLKEQPNGEMDLNPCIYDFSLALLDKERDQTVMDLHSFMPRIDDYADKSELILAIIHYFMSLKQNKSQAR